MTIIALLPMKENFKSLVDTYKFKLSLATDCREYTSVQLTSNSIEVI